MTTNNEPAIEERMRDAEEAIEPGELKPGVAIGQSDGMTMTT